MPTMQMRNYRGLGFSNIHVCGAILIIINTINLPRCLYTECSYTPLITRRNADTTRVTSVSFSSNMLQNVDKYMFLKQGTAFTKTVLSHRLLLLTL